MDVIRLGLARINRLLDCTALPWRAIHVAGTNGKGSVCAYASAILTAGKIRCGRFTSPHLIDRWDCIVVNEEIVDKKLFHEVEASVMERNNENNIRASPFELLTAVAFEVFVREKVEVGVIEVGLGGKDDATNALRDPLVTVITKIGKDHQNILGNTLEEIAFHKAGIMKKGVPCIVDATNFPNVLNVLEQNAKLIDAGSFTQIPRAIKDTNTLMQDFLSKYDFEPHEKVNIQLAAEAVKHVLQYVNPNMKLPDLLSAIPKTSWPGRLQHVSIKSITGRMGTVLLDGAHNTQSAEVLGGYVDARLRRKSIPITWVMAFSKGKNIRNLISCLVRPGDYLVANKFGPVDGMPWVQSEDSEDILQVAQTLNIFDQTQNSSDTVQALHRATELSKDGPLVVAGSLYQVSDVLRLLRSVEGSNAL